MSSERSRVVAEFISTNGSPGAVPFVQCQHLRSKDIEEACASLDLEQRFRPRQAMLVPNPPVRESELGDLYSLSDHTRQGWNSK